MLNITKGGIICMRNKTKSTSIIIIVLSALLVISLFTSFVYWDISRYNINHFYTLLFTNHFYFGIEFYAVFFINALLYLRD